MSENRDPLEALREAHEKWWRDKGKKSSQWTTFGASEQGFIAGAFEAYERLGYESREAKEFRQALAASAEPKGTRLCVPHDDYPIPLEQLNAARAAHPAPQGCPICGCYPIKSVCVKDWLLINKMPLHSEWQERMAQYANEILRNVLVAQQQSKVTDKDSE